MIASGILRVLFAVLLFIAACIPGTAEDAASLIDQGHYKHARAILQKRLAANPKDADVLTQFARVKLKYHELDEAIELAKQAALLKPNDALAHRTLGQCYLEKVNRVSLFQKLGVGRSIKTELELALSLEPNDAETLWGLAFFNHEAPSIVGAQKDKASGFIDRIQTTDPVLGALYKARFAELGKQFDQARTLSLKAAELGPQSYWALTSASETYLDEKARDLGKAEEFANKALKVDPGRNRAYVLLAEIYSLQLRRSDLDKLLATAEQESGDDLNPHYQAAKIILLTTHNDYPRAEKYFRRYLTQEPEAGSPGWGTAHWRLGQVLEKEERKQEAIRELEEAIQILQTEPDSKPDLEAAKKDLKRMKG